eukprot:TRINITY_DN1880_c0_g1_i5.p1 TRINITY_DN1880_c0_g1~~TRINITY_DN1880_c0_g1_i5.p1  ORF type:complete len:139 (-),score=28.21 TRINITY_DN1880_c0_g1_i5:37-429(-)
MQRIKEWWQSKSSVEEKITRAEKEYEDALNNLASLLHNCEDVQHDLHLCAANENAGLDELKQKCPVQFGQVQGCEAIQAQQQFKVYVSCRQHQEGFQRCITGSEPEKCVQHLQDLYACAKNALEPRALKE